MSKKGEKIGEKRRDLFKLIKIARRKNTLSYSIDWKWYSNRIVIIKMLEISNIKVVREDKGEDNKP